jgi:serine/threonine protein kinase
MPVRIENLAEPIPGYRLLERIGGGGFGEVWKCEAPGGLHKAMKFVFGDLGAAGDDGRRAEQELKALSRVKTVRHPYILSLERYDIVDGQLVIVMELADRNLWDRFKECRAQGLPGIPHEELLGYMQETAEALDLMNGQYQLQHLDIKPQNLFLVHQHVKVADFGLVKDLEGMKASVTGGVTPVYASPETFDGYVSRFSDQYSLAIVYQELLTGQRPFNGTNVRQLILQHLQAPPDVSSLPSVEQPIIARALSKEPNDRYPNCLALLEALRQSTPRPPGGSGQVPVVAVSRCETKEDSGACTTPTSMAAKVRRGTKDEGRGPNAAPTPERTAVRTRRTLESSPASGYTAMVSGYAVAAPRPSDPGTQRAPDEIRGEGILFPALVLGIGQMGLVALQQLRQALSMGLNSQDLPPHVRLLLLDTDSPARRGEGTGTRLEQTPGTLTPGFSPQAPAFLHIPLNRPSYYLKSRETQAALARWMPPRMLYRIPRSQLTTGVRALGRLAFCDNYRRITARLKKEIAALLAPDVLAAAEGQTGLGIRTNRVRVYLVCGLGGGTGSGIFLDLAYTVRALLRQMGYEHPDVVGLFFLPDVVANCSRTLTLGNTYAALTELSYYATPGTVFRCVYQPGDPPLEDAAPPLSRVVLLGLPEETDETAARRVLGMAGQYLYRDLITPLGKTADLARAGLSSPPWERRGLAYQTFNMFRLSWPRQRLFEIVGQRLCRRLVERWMSKDSKPLREPVQTWVLDQWTRAELGTESFINQLTRECAQRMGREPEATFKEILQPLVDKYAPQNGSASGTSAMPPRSPSKVAAASAGKTVEMSAEEIAETLSQFQELLGQPTEDGPLDLGGSLAQQVCEAAEHIGKVWAQKLAELPARLIEDPAFRLAGAEEAVRQLGTMLEQVLQHHEPLYKDLAGRAQEAYERLRALAAPAWGLGPGDRELQKTSSSLFLRNGRRSTVPATDVLELFRGCAKWRYQSLVLNQMSSTFVTLRGHMADQMREVNFCRVRLGELLRTLSEDQAGDASRVAGSGSKPGLPSATPQLPADSRVIFPSGCKDLTAAAADLLSKVGPEALKDLDSRMEAMLQQKFRALAYVCLSDTNALAAVHRAMLDTAGAFAAESFGPPTDVARLFFEQHPDEEQAETELAGFFDQAAPASLGAPSASAPSEPKAELCVLLTPPGDAGQRFGEVAQRAVHGVELHATCGGAGATAEIVLYRERSNLPLANLEQLGTEARDAYLRMTSTEHFTPHSRLDVKFTRE